MNGTTSGESVEITTTDGRVLGGTLFRAGAGSRVIIVQGATAVPHQFYRRFAAFMQQRGTTTLTYDFRGTGESGPDSLKGYKAACSDWGLIDMPSVLDWVSHTLSPDKIYFVGHSAGGQQAGLIDKPELVDAMVTVCAQSGYWRYQGGAEKQRVFAMVYFFLPLVTRLFGYFPWSRFASGNDLPKDVALQWARWCRHPDYLFSDSSLPLQRYKEFRAPVLAYSIDDDNWGTAKSVDALMQRAYANVERQHIVPSEHGLTKLGHMGFFRQGSETLWQEVYDWLVYH